MIISSVRNKPGLIFPSSSMNRTALHCTALYSVALHCTALPYTSRACTVMYCIYCTVLLQALRPLRAGSLRNHPTSPSSLGLSISSGIMARGDSNSWSLVSRDAAYHRKKSEAYYWLYSGFIVQLNINVFTFPTILYQDFIYFFL